MKRVAVILSVMSVGLLLGCSSRTDFTQADQELTPPPIDDATRLRNFDPTTATYANGDTVAGHTGFVYSPERYRSPWNYYFVDPGVFVSNLATSPYWLVTNPGAMRYEGLRFEPTYTANPALPMSHSTREVESRPTVSPIPITPEPSDESTLDEPIDVTDDEMPNEPDMIDDLPIEPATPVEDEPATP